MKIKTGLVSNSSSSSFTIVQNKYDRKKQKDALIKALKKNISKEFFERLAEHIIGKSDLDREKNKTSGYISESDFDIEDQTLIRYFQDFNYKNKDADIEWRIKQ